MYSIEAMKDSHASSVMSILNHYIEHDYSAYFDRPLPDFFFERLREMTQNYPAIVVLNKNDSVVGFAFLHAYHVAPTFNRTAEITYFIDTNHTHKGIGRLMLDHLINEALLKGIDSIIASVSSLNERSIAFHSKNGFKECGRLSAVGTKFGQNFDVVYMQRKVKG